MRDFDGACFDGSVQLLNACSKMKRQRESSDSNDEEPEQKLRREASVSQDEEPGQKQPRSTTTIDETPPVTDFTVIESDESDEDDPDFLKEVDVVDDESSGDGKHLSATKTTEKSSVDELLTMFEVMDKNSLDVVINDTTRPKFSFPPEHKKAKKGEKTPRRIVVCISIKTLVIRSFISLIPVPDELQFRGESSKSIKEAKNKAAQFAIDYLRNVTKKTRAIAQNRVSKELDLQLAAWRDDANRKESRRKAFAIVRNVIQKQFYGSRVVMFGSSTYGLALPNSDVDISVTLPSPVGLLSGFNDQYFHSAGILNYLSGTFKAMGMKNVYVVETARVPVLKYYDLGNRVKVDVVIQRTSLRDDQSLLRSRLIRTIVQSHPQIWEVATVIKHWAERRRINSALDGYINSMTWVLMAIWFLQIREPPVAPTVLMKNCGTQNKERDAVFSKVVNRGDAQSLSVVPTTLELLIEFFEFFHEEFESRKWCISVREGRCIPRETLEKRDPAAPYYVEDPLKPTVNLASKLRGRLYDIFKDEIHRALRYLRDFGTLERLCSERREEHLPLQTSVPREPRRFNNRPFKKKPPLRRRPSRTATGPRSKITSIRKYTSRPHN